MKRKVYNPCLIITVILLFLFLVNQNILEAGVEIGDIVENFTLPDFEGNNHSLYDYEGQVIFINFWAVI